MKLFLIAFLNTNTNESGQTEGGNELVRFEFRRVWSGTWLIKFRSFDWTRSWRFAELLDERMLDAIPALRLFDISGKFMLAKLVAMVLAPAFEIKSYGTQQAAWKTVLSEAFLGMFVPRPRAEFISRLEPSDWMSWIESVSGIKFIWGRLKTVDNGELGATMVSFEQVLHIKWLKNYEQLRKMLLIVDSVIGVFGGGLKYCAITPAQSGAIGFEMKGITWRKNSVWLVV